MSKTITYLSVRRRVECKGCKGKGEVFSNMEDTNLSDDQLVIYVCKKCKGKGFKMNHRSISLEQLRELKN